MGVELNISTKVDLEGVTITVIKWSDLNYFNALKKCNDTLYPIVSAQIELKNCINKDL